MPTNISEEEIRERALYLLLEMVMKCGFELDNFPNKYKNGCKYCPFRSKNGSIYCETDDLSSCPAAIRNYLEKEV